MPAAARRLRYVPDADLGSIDPSSVAQSCEVLLKELSSKAGLPVLIVIDDLDKVHDENVQASVYIDRAMAWMRLPCSVVATLPFETYFGTRASEVDDLWGAVHVLDPMPVPQEDGGDLKEPALQPYLTMVREAGANKVISAVQCRRLANLSGGLPRAFVHYCSSCVRYALEAGDAHVRDHQVDLVLRDMTAKWRGRLTDEDCQAIVRVLDSGGSNLRRRQIASRRSTYFATGMRILKTRCNPRHGHGLSLMLTAIVILKKPVLPDMYFDLDEFARDLMRLQPGIALVTWEKAPALHSFLVGSQVVA